MIGDKLQRAIDGKDFRGRGQRRPVDHDDLDAQLPRGVQFGHRWIAAGIFSHQMGG